ncbi:MAG: nucleotidyltransferase domain-containing protein [Elusimicrobia bacterium]|nr:nucleotidyltransferase domain-containing protein [Elusimicrobiota bacterium]
MSNKQFNRGADKKAIKFLARRVAAAFPVEKIILFGSHAYGKPTPDSDVDLFVVMPSKKRPAERVRDIWDVIYPAPFPLDFIVRTPKEVERRLKLGDFFIRDIMEKGTPLYVRRSH